MPNSKWYSQVPAQDPEFEPKPYGDEEGVGIVYSGSQDDDGKRYIPAWMSICVMFAPLVTLFNIFVMVFYTNGFTPSFGDVSHAKTIEFANTLRHPNMYIGLENVNTDVIHKVLPDSLHVFPHIFQPVNRSQPAQVFPFDGRPRITFNGKVSPGEPHVIINKDVSTGSPNMSVSMIIQVRVQDFGLERCSIASVMPDSAKLSKHNRTLTLAQQSTNIDLWALDASQGEVDVTTLSWSSRPRRTEFISTVFVKEGEHTHSSEFDCGRSGSLRIFELACPEGGGAECSIEFWQEQPETDPRMAFTIVQKPSI